jgi:CHAT domain-containing protein
MLIAATMRNQTTEQAIRAQAVAVANQIKQLDRLIAAQFSGYSALVTKSSVSAEEVQKQLGSNEALLLFTTTSRFTFVWTVTRSDIRWHAAPVGAKQLAETISILRCGLDDGAWTDKTQTPCAEKLGRQPGAGEQLPFDLERAFALYQALFEPVAKDIEGKELILVPSGPLATLPFQVLLTEKPAAGIGDQTSPRRPGWSSGLR